ncbi:hypothetical protein BV898_13071 [Hypsibius exemplaris]|uniref:Uncharacterized protein n=1 Tax=Hypsibius exemplaris TaxID=2072580 RepID=A0A1W0WBX5_HYPEX|nr:hypothetical protein BV898_13071 [Hypsibius exemplaris]
MSSAESFTDLHLTYIDEPSAHQLILQAAALGYSVVVLTYTAFSDDFSMAKPKGDKSTLKAASPNPIVLLPESLTVNSCLGTPMKIFRRLSVPVADPRVYHHLANHPLCKTFDVVSVAPSDERLLQQALDDVNVDIIELDLGAKHTINLKRKHARQAQANGKFFEVCYRTALGGADTRGIFFANCRRLLGDLNPGDCGKVPDVVVLSSGAADASLMRSPLELGFLCELFGFPRPFQQHLNTRTARQALESALAKRRTARNAIQIILE